MADFMKNIFSVKCLLFSSVRKLGLFQLELVSFLHFCRPIGLQNMLPFVPMLPFVQVLIHILKHTRTRTHTGSLTCTAITVVPGVLMAAWLSLALIVCLSLRLPGMLALMWRVFVE